MVNNEDFDNDDNPYGQFILHMYTNMDNLSDTSTNDTKSDSVDSGESLYKFEDKFIPLKLREQALETSWRKNNIK